MKIKAENLKAGTLKLRMLKLICISVLQLAFVACAQFTGNAPRIRTNDVAGTDNRVPLTNLSSAGATSGQIPVATNGNSIVWRDAPAGGSLDTNGVLSLIQSNTIAIDSLASAGQTNLFGIGPNTNPIPLIISTGLNLDNSGHLTAAAQTFSGTNLVINGTGANIMDNLTLTNLTFAATNSAPTSVILGTTAPDTWVVFTNGTTRYFMPAWINH